MKTLRFCPRVALRVGALALLLSWLTWLGHDSWQWLQGLDQNGHPPPPELVAAPSLPPDTAAIARLFGVQPQEAASNQPRVPLKLVASLVGSSPELSRALIESPDGSRFYSIGEPLPGGGSLREIGTEQVHVQRFGEDQALSLASHTTSLLIPLPAAQESPSSTAARADDSHIQPYL
ncbi:type II secretion system protein N [Pseudomonas protegens]|uniref:type II secretion system protein N n=1 Tax=Pseudomonas protegens TaxID=380021 RepID=UPI001C8DD4AC|nr:type II secretion system protein N [Pseudomonas protegens]QZI72943.1 hypothetical protein K5F93_12160 [Pseudomonas protegens]WOE77407.1 type II secretion system protein N [Pseudomonas protegens]